MELLLVPSSKTPSLGNGCTSPLHHFSQKYVDFDDNWDWNYNRNNCSTACPSLKNQFQLQLPVRRPKQNLLFPGSVGYDNGGISTEPLPSTFIGWTRSKRKKKRKRVNTAQTTTSDILRLMDGLGFSIPIDIYNSLIEECTVSGEPNTAIELLTHITQCGIKPTLRLLNRLLVMLVSCGLVESAHHLFDSMTVRDFNSWAILFVAYFENDDYEEATNISVSMLNKLGVVKFPTWIWACFLKACAFSVNFSLGKQFHGWLLKLGICDDMFLTSSLMSFYGRLKCLEDANLAFNQVSRHNTLTWKAKIINDCREEHFSEVLSDFKEMGRQGIKKNSFIYSSVLKACGRMLNHEHCGEHVHADAIKLGLVFDNYVQCGLIDMYGRSGLLREAKKVFEMTQDESNVACWNAMLMVYIHHDLCIEAIKFLYQMKAAGMQPQESLLDKVRNVV